MEKQIRIKRDKAVLSNLAPYIRAGRVIAVAYNDRVVIVTLKEKS